MVTIDVLNGIARTYQCDFADLAFSGNFIAQFADNRRLPEIAEEFDGARSVTVHDVLTDKTYEGYGKLIHCSIDGDKVKIILAKDEAENDDSGN